jgi:hypothetical protein
VDTETIADKLELRAIKEGWPITPEQRATIIGRAMTRATCGNPDIEDRAAKILLAADAVNLKQKQLEQKTLEAEHARKLQLLEAAIRLGIVGDGHPTTGSVLIPAPAS